MLSVFCLKKYQENFKKCIDICITLWYNVYTKTKGGVQN